MPLAKITLSPGVNRDDTPLSSEGGWVNSDKVRFDRDRPQTIGGWDATSSSTFAGIARGGHAWSDSTGRRYFAWGTAAGLFLEANGSKYDITPVHSSGVLNNALTTATGSPS
jgi:hypothetical protein